MIELMPCAEQHRWLLHGWRNARHVARYMYDDREIDTATHDRWYTALLADPDRWGFVVTDDSVPVGACFLSGYRRVERRAEFGLYIADVTRRGRGAGAAALVLLCTFGFETVGLHKLVGEALGTNTAAIALYARLGFVTEGELRDHLWRDGMFVPVRLMALFDDTLEELHAMTSTLRARATIS